LNKSVEKIVGVLSVEKIVGVLSVEQIVGVLKKHVHIHIVCRNFLPGTT